MTTPWPTPIIKMPVSVTKIRPGSFGCSSNGKVFFVWKEGEDCWSGIEEGEKQKFATCLPTKKMVMQELDLQVDLIAKLPQTLRGEWGEVQCIGARGVAVRIYSKKGEIVWSTRTSQELGIDRVALKEKGFVIVSKFTEEK